MTFRAGQHLAAALLPFIVLTSWADYASADSIPVCSMPRDEFVEAAFPANSTTKLHGGRLLKYAHSPGLIVLLPEEEPAMRAHIQAAFDQIKRDDLVRPTRSVMQTYGEFSELADVVEQLGSDNIFVLVAEEPTDSEESKQYRLALEHIMHSPKDVDALAAKSKNTGGFAVRSRMDFMTAEVKATAVVINPRNEAAQIGLMVYIAYYAGVSPNAASTGSFLRRFFLKTPEASPELADFGRHYFSVFGDDRVKNGATKDLFIECGEQP